MDIEADFVGEVARHLVNSAKAEGIAVDATQKPEQIILDYLNWNSRQVVPARRRVQLSREFACPPAYHDALRKIRASIEGGRDITGHLSRKISDVRFMDQMLVEWGVQHLHLSIKKSTKKPSIFEGTKELLFARFTPTDAYFINVYKHGDWSDTTIVQILHDNWPDSIKQFRMPPGTGNGAGLLTTEQRRNLRANGCNSAFETTGGAVYMLGGFVTPGCSIYDFVHCDRLCLNFRAHERQARDAVAENPLFAGRTTVKLDLTIVGPEAHIKDAQTGVTVYRFSHQP